MTAVVSMLRGINLAGHNRIRMDELRTLYESIVIAVRIVLFRRYDDLALRLIGSLNHNL